jgi:hypothetical protein
MVNRNPDVAATSRDAALDVPVAKEGKFDLPPEKSLSMSWPQTFMAHEFKCQVKDHAHKFDDIAKVNFTATTRAETVDQSMPDKSFF